MQSIPISLQHVQRYLISLYPGTHSSTLLQSLRRQGSECALLGKIIVAQAISNVRSAYTSARLDVGHRCWQHITGERWERALLALLWHPQPSVAMAAVHSRPFGICMLSGGLMAQLTRSTSRRTDRTESVILLRAVPWPCTVFLGRRTATWLRTCISSAS